MKELKQVQANQSSDIFQVFHEYRTYYKVERRKLLRKINKLKRRNIVKVQEKYEDKRPNNQNICKKQYNEESLWDVLFDQPKNFKYGDMDYEMKSQENPTQLFYDQSRHQSNINHHICPEKKLLFILDFPDFEFNSM